jgi:glycosyltransferase involved in cell wall biosynthesis
MIKEINKKLQYLRDNPKKREKVGEKNLIKILDKWNWKSTVREFDIMFETPIESIEEIIISSKSRTMEVRKILIGVDVYGWAFDFAARGIQKYSKYDVTIKRWDEIEKSDCDIYDAIFLMNKSCCRPEVRDEITRRVKNKCVGIRTGLVNNGLTFNYEQPIEGWKISCNSVPTYNYLKNKMPNVYLCHNGVDTEIFKPMERPKDRFIIGWAGSNRDVKRVHLLRQLDYPVRIMSNYGKEFFVKDRSREEMVEFYKSIDCYVCVSSLEGMPQPILEASATSLPIVSTDVGGISDIIGEWWLVPSNPENLAIGIMNRRLEELKNNLELRLEVGKQNLEKILNKWSWKYIVKEYDEMFEDEIV